MSVQKIKLSIATQFSTRFYLNNIVDRPHPTCRLCKATCLLLISGRNEEGLPPRHAACSVEALLRSIWKYQRSKTEHGLPSKLEASRLSGDEWRQRFRAMDRQKFHWKMRSELRSYQEVPNHRLVEPTEWRRGSYDRSRSS